MNFKFKDVDCSNAVSGKRQFVLTATGEDGKDLSIVLSENIGKDLEEHLLFVFRTEYAGAQFRTNQQKQIEEIRKKLDAEKAEKDRLAAIEIEEQAKAKKQQEIAERQKRIEDEKLAEQEKKKAELAQFEEAYKKEIGLVPKNGA